MANTIMLATAGVGPVKMQDGTLYTPDVNGYVSVVPGHIPTMQSVGYITGVFPSGVQTTFGGSGQAVPNPVLGQFAEEGNIYRNVGIPIAGNGADTTDDIIGGFQLPANAFDVAKRGIQLVAQGKFGATGNNKRVRIWLNPTMAGQTVNADGSISGGTVSGAGSGLMLYDSGTQTGNNVGWSLLANLFKYGAAGSNTQYAQISPIFGATHGGIGLPIAVTMPENAVINFVVTGASQTTGAANDVVLDFVEANAMN